MSDLDKERIRDTVKMLMKQLDQFQDEVPELTDDYHRLFLYYVADQPVAS